MSIETKSQILTAGQTWPLMGGNFLQIISGENLNVKFFDQRGKKLTEALAMNAGLIVRDDFFRVEIYSATSQTVKVIIGEGNAEYASGSDVNATINIGTSLTNGTPATVGVAAAVAVAANASRKALTLRNSGATNIYIGGTGVTIANAGRHLAPGEELEMVQGATAAIYAIGDAAGGSLAYTETT